MMGTGTAPSSSPTKSSRVEKSVGQPDAGGFFTRGLFKDNCVSEKGDETISKSIVCFVFIMACCVFYPILTLTITALRIRNTEYNVQRENRMRLFGSIALQIIVPLISGLIMYGAYDTCNAMYAYVIGLLVCTFSGLLNVYFLLAPYGGIW